MKSSLKVPVSVSRRPRLLESRNGKSEFAPPFMSAFSFLLSDLSFAESSSGLGCGPTLRFNDLRVQRVNGGAVEQFGTTRTRPWHDLWHDLNALKPLQTH